MIFPIGDDNIQGGHKPMLTYTFLAMNIMVFLAEMFVFNANIDQFFDDFAVVPAEILRGEDMHTLLTSMFLHGGVMHLAGNMLFLWVFADNIEAIIGPAKFLLFYLAGGIVGSLVHIAFNLGSVIPSLGASGAISAVLGAYLIMFPKSRIKVLFFIKIIYVSALMFLGFWILQQLFSGFASIGPETAQTGGTAWWAHIGGFAFGLVCGIYFRKSNFSYKTLV